MGSIADLEKAGYKIADQPDGAFIVSGEVYGVSATTTIPPLPDVQIGRAHV